MQTLRRIPSLSLSLRHFCTANATATTTATVTSASTSTLPSPPPSHGRVPPSIWSKTTHKLHQRRDHPLHTLRTHIESHFHTTYPQTFSTFNDLPCVVTTTQCFDDLLVPRDHPSRADSDTYYLDERRLLRAHMTAHDVDMLRRGERAFLMTGDVYRRDTVDRTHYPVFHQMDGVRIYEEGVGRKQVESELKTCLEGIARGLFGDVSTRWVEASFPFTTPSMELEVEWRGEWLEVLGCGLLQREVLRRAGVEDGREGWAFGLGLERLAMVLYGVPDIRLFWSEDERIMRQFRGKGIGVQYVPVSVYPAIEKDVAFWVDEGFERNDLFEIVREICGDLVETVEMVDRFERGGKLSLCFRILFRCMERSLTHDEVNALYFSVRERVAESLPVSLR